MEKSLTHVHTLGWTTDSLAQAAADMDLPPTMHGVVSDGPVEMVEFFLRKKNKHVRHAIENEYLSGRSGSTSTGADIRQKDGEGGFVEDKVVLERILCAHIEYLRPYSKRWPEAAALLLDPMRAFSSLALLYETVGDIAELSGVGVVQKENEAAENGEGEGVEENRSSNIGDSGNRDSESYTKSAPQPQPQPQLDWLVEHGLLATLYGSAELHMLGVVVVVVVVVKEWGGSIILVRERERRRGEQQQHSWLRL